ncbi:MAG: peptidase M16-like, partial [Acidobacteria bacterium]|nr:peptidase M16-like [Acidobacteriota bacterium]
KYYVPSNMVIAVVGDVKASETLPMLERYFSRLPKGTPPEPLRTVEPPQSAERTVVLRDKAQPIYLEGYHRPAATDADDAVYEVISMLLSNGRTSRMYKTLVRDKKIAAFAGGFNGFPGDKYPNLFTFFAATTPGHTPAEVTDAIHAEVERLKSEDVSADELQSIKTRAKAGLIRQLDSNFGLAQQLVAYQTRYGDWRELFRSVDKIDQVSAQDIRRIANATFVSNNRTIAYIDASKPAASPAKGDTK